MIEIIAETVDGIFNDSKELRKILRKNKTKRVSNWWYLHGELEEDVGFDKGIMLDNDSLKCLEYIDKDINKQYKTYYLGDGIYDVKITQINKPCKGYFWTEFRNCGNIEGKVPVMHGLVCYTDDEKANKYALTKFKEKSEIL